MRGEFSIRDFSFTSWEMLQISMLASEKLADMYKVIERIDCYAKVFHFLEIFPLHQ